MTWLPWRWRRPSLFESYVITSLDKIQTRLSDIERKQDMADANLNAIAASFPKLQADVGELITLAKTALQTPPDDPRAADIEAQIEALSASIEAVTKPAPAPVPSTDQPAV